MGFIFGGPSPSFLVLVGSVVLALVAWLVIGGVLGTWLELALVRAVASDEDVAADEASAPIAAGDGLPNGGGPWRALLLRLVAHLPTDVALTWGAARLVDEAYVELIRPGDPSIPVAIRVFLRLPEVIGLILIAWIAGEAVGGAATRHVARGTGLGRAGVGAILSVVRPGGLVVLLATTTAVGVALLVGLAAVSIAFEHARVVLVDGGTGLEAWLALGLLSVSWAAWLTLMGAAAAWRSAAWTLEVGRRGGPAAASAD